MSVNRSDCMMTQKKNKKKTTLFWTRKRAPILRVIETNLNSGLNSGKPRFLHTDAELQARKVD